MFRNLMMPRICYAPEGEGAGGEGTPPAGTPPADGGTPPIAATAPWAEAKDVWTVGPDNAKQPWYATIQEEPVRQLMEAKKYKNPAELAVAYSNANKISKISPDVAAVIEGNASDEQRNNFYRTMGRPESSDKYDLKPGEGVAVDENMMKFGKDLFHEMGLNNKQAQAAMDKWNKFAAAAGGASVEADRIANDKAVDALMASYGEEGKKNQAAGERVTRALGLSADNLAKIESAIGGAAMIDLFVRIGQKSGEGGLKGGSETVQDPNDVTLLTPAQAQTKIESLQGNPEFMKKYNDKQHPEHATALAQMEALFVKKNNKK